MVDVSDAGPRNSREGEGKGGAGPQIRSLSHRDRLQRLNCPYPLNKKTFRLWEFERLVQSHGYFHEHVDVTEDVSPIRLASIFRRVLLAMGARLTGEGVPGASYALKAS